MNLYALYTTSLASVGQTVLQALKLSRDGELRAMRYLFQKNSKRGDVGMLELSLNHHFRPKDMIDYKVTITHPFVGDTDKWEKNNGFSNHKLVAFVVGPEDGKLFYEDASELLDKTEIYKHLASQTQKEV